MCSLLSNGFGVCFPYMSMIIPGIAFSFARAITPIENSLFSSGAIPRVVHYTSASATVDRRDVGRAFLDDLYVSCINLRFGQVGVVGDRRTFCAADVRVVYRAGDHVDSVFRLCRVGLI